MGPAPLGPGGAWTLTFNDDFDGGSLDTDRWVATEAWSVNNVTSRAANVSVSGGLLRLQLSSSTEGAHVLSDVAEIPGPGPGVQFPVGGFAEARVYFPGSEVTGEDFYNWSAWWTSGPAWPAAGEHDVAEVLTDIAPASSLTVNYHSPSGAHNQGEPPGDWNNAFHTYGIHRKASTADVYWDGQLVKTYATDDNGADEFLLFTVGKSNSRTPVTGSAGELQVDYARVWVPA